MCFDQIESAMRGTKKPAGFQVETGEQVLEMARNWTRYVRGLEGYG